MLRGTWSKRERALAKSSLASSKSSSSSSRIQPASFPPSPTRCHRSTRASEPSSIFRRRRPEARPEWVRERQHDRDGRYRPGLVHNVVVLHIVEKLRMSTSGSAAGDTSSGARGARRKAPKLLGQLSCHTHLVVGRNLVLHFFASRPDFHLDQRRLVLRCTRTGGGGFSAGEGVADREGE